MWSRRPLRIAATVYAFVAVAMWPVPLLNTLHVESAAVLALVAFFTAGISSIFLAQDGVTVSRTLAGQLLVLIVPLGLQSAAMFWVPNCSPGTGLMFFGLFPVISVILAVTLGVFVVALRLKHPLRVFVGVGVVICLATPVYDVGFHPQLYTYNHVFGGVLGPIYDEELAIRTGLFAFRGMTLLWALFLLLGSLCLRRRVGLKSPLVAATAAVTVVIAVGYAHSADLGWNTSSRQIQEVLGHRLVSDHFEVYYDGRSFRPGELDRVLEEMEFRYSTISRALAEDVPSRTLVYLYPTASLKGDLTGSMYTSVTPVWLGTPQIHMLARRVQNSFDHELVHVFSREFGLPILRASLSVGLVEGLASALEAPDGHPSARDLMAATILAEPDDSSEVVASLVASLGAFGFWTGRGAVSYAASGSFVDFLLRSYGANAFKQVYRTSDFSAAYGHTARELAGRWYYDLKQIDFISAAAGPAAERLFSIPSLFEMECPHKVPRFVRDYRYAADMLAVSDTAAAVGALRRSVATGPDFLPAAVTLASLLLRSGDYEEAKDVLPADSASQTYPAVMMLAADVSAVLGRAADAENIYRTLLDSLPDFMDEARATLLVRRQLAGRPEVMRFLIDEAPSAEPPSDLWTDPAAPAAVLLRDLDRNQNFRACEAGLRQADYLSGGFSEEESALLRRQTLFWAGEACEDAGRAEIAQYLYSQSIEAYTAVGNVDDLRLAEDRLQRVRWKLSADTLQRKP